MTAAAGLSPYPWNEPLVGKIGRDRDRLPHALLFAGPRGLGKEAIAAWLAQYVLCLSPASGSACGTCQSCRLYLAGSHPDFHVVQPEAIYKNSDTLLSRFAWRYSPAEKGKDSKDSVVIRIDQIRTLILHAQTRPQIGTRTVMVLSPADGLNTHAANSLLKLLEEPPAGSCLILVADRPGRLPATIRSRCARVEFRVPAETDALAWLAAQGLTPSIARQSLAWCGGAPLAALAMAKSDFGEHHRILLEDIQGLSTGKADPLSCAARWKPIGAERCLLWLQVWLNDLIISSMQPVQDPVRRPEARANLQALEKRLDLKQLFHFTDSLARSRDLLGGPLDEQLLLEDILIRWTELCRT